jgi:hypothetical protein
VRRLSFASRDVLGEPHPGLGQGEPQRLVPVAIGSARHRYALLGMPPVMVVSPHFKSPTYALPRGIRRVQCGAEAIPPWPNAGVARSEYGDATQLFRRRNSRDKMSGSL